MTYGSAVQLTAASRRKAQQKKLARAEEIVRSVRVKQGTESLTSSVSNLFETVTKVEQQVNEYLKHRKKDVATVVQVREDLDGVSKRVERLEKKSKVLRLGGSCMHGADRGPKCTKCMAKSGTLQGPYAALPPGLEVAQNLIKDLDESEQKCFAIGLEHDRLVNILNECDERFRVLKRSLEGVQRKLAEMVRRTPGSEPTSQTKPPPKSKRPVSSTLMEKTAQTQPVIKRRRDQTDKDKDVIYRLVQVTTGPFQFHNYVYPAGTTSAQESQIKTIVNQKLAFAAERSGLGRSQGTKAVRVTTVANMKKMVALSAALSYPQRDRKALVECRVAALSLKSDPGVALGDSTNIFEIGKGENVLYLNASTSLEPTAKAGVPLAESYRRLLLTRPRWGHRNSSDLLCPARFLEPNRAVLAVLEEIGHGNDQNLDLSCLALDDDHFAALCAGICVGHGRFESLDVSFNAIGTLEPLVQPLLQHNCFMHLKQLKLRGLMRARGPNQRDIGNFFKALRSSVAVKVLEKLDVSDLPLLRQECFCNEQASSASARAASCRSEHQAMKECCTYFGQAISACGRLETLLLEGCIQASTPLSPCSFDGEDVELKEALECAFSSIEHISTLKTVSVAQCAYKSIEVCQVVLRFLLCHPTIGTVDISGTEILNGQADAFTKELLVRSNMSVLSLYASPKVAHSLVRNLSPFEMLSKLDLSHCDLKSHIVEQLFRSLTSCNRALSMIDVSHNPSAFEAPLSSLEALSGFVRSTETLLDLRLVNVGIREWPKYLAAMNEAVDGRSSQLPLRTLELGEQVDDLCSPSVDVADLLDFLSKDMVRLGALRLWYAHAVLLHFADFECAGQFPPSFDVVCAKALHQPRAETFLYRWPDGSAIDILMPAA